MSNPIEIYKETIGDVEQQETPRQAAQKDAERQQKNIEAWHLWNSIPQTQMFRALLQDTRNKMSVGCAQNVANVPQVTDAWIRARLVEISMLDEILHRTMLNGELKTELFTTVAKEK